MTLIPKEPEKEIGQKARQMYLKLARQVMSRSNLDYLELYQQFAENDWAALKLDDAVAELGLRSGLSPRVVMGVLHQGPYIQHLVHQKNMPVAPMSQYARSTVMTAMQKVRQVQEQAKPQERSSSIEME
jgi:hypothetical protein